VTSASDFKAGDHVVVVKGDTAIPCIVSAVRRNVVMCRHVHSGQHVASFRDGWRHTGVCYGATTRLFKKGDYVEREARHRLNRGAYDIVTAATFAPLSDIYNAWEHVCAALKALGREP